MQGTPTRMSVPSMSALRLPSFIYHVTEDDSRKIYVDPSCLSSKQGGRNCERIYLRFLWLSPRYVLSMECSVERTVSSKLMCGCGINGM